MDIVFIGAGNLASQLAPAFVHAGHRVVQVFSRTVESGQQLAGVLGCGSTAHFDNIRTDAALYVFAVPDHVLKALAGQLCASFSARQPNGHWQQALYVHTAGSVSASVLPFSRRGVFYPLQTFSKIRAVDFSRIPIFVEGEGEEERLLALGRSISGNVRVLDTTSRRKLHLAAVFVNNFTNYMYTLGSKILAESGIDFEVLHPLIAETASKACQIAPHEAQTGPARRDDEDVMATHLSLLHDARLQAIYRILSQSIKEEYTQQ